jgi:nucleoside-diphosphate kinase
MAEQTGNLTFGIIKPDAVRSGKMGATDPAKADEGTLRKEFANSIGENAVHGSDSEENTRIELAYFFSRLEFV